LWPQPFGLRPGAHEKDVIEDRLHREVCAGRMTLGEAQAAVAGRWRELYLGPAR
jgi:hypothetical protein